MLAHFGNMSRVVGQAYGDTLGTCLGGLLEGFGEVWGTYVGHLLGMRSNLNTRAIRTGEVFRFFSHSSVP